MSYFISRPVRAPGIPERRYSKNENDYGQPNNYPLNNNFVQDRGSLRFGMREPSAEINKDSFHNNWNFDVSPGLLFLRN